MRLAPLIEHFEAPFLAQYAHRLLPGARRALSRMKHCRHPDAEHTLAACPQCLTDIALPHSCGHRSCPGCQHRDAERWLNCHRQQLLPAPYFLVTFTVPQPVRALAFAHQRGVYDALLRCAWQCLAQFAHNDPKLAGDLGATAVLHTHNRRRDYHPHVHVLVPAGALAPKHRRWRQKSRYLFNARNLGRVFRGKMRDALRKAGLKPPEDGVTHWIVDCQHVGAGDSTLVYLARYLYRGVLSEHDILDCRDGCVTFRYIEARTGEQKLRTLPGADFLWLLLQHVLPKGFRRTRDFGLLHPRRAALLRRLQHLLRVNLLVQPSPKRAPLRCPRCATPLYILAPRLPPNPVRDGPTPTNSTWRAVL